MDNCPQLARIRKEYTNNTEKGWWRMKLVWILYAGTTASMVSGVYLNSGASDALIVLAFCLSMATIGAAFLYAISKEE